MGEIPDEPMIDKEEPYAIDGRDYIAQPLPNSFFVNLIKRGFTTKEPFTWLNERKPVEWLIHEKKHGLQKLIMAGVRIEDFLKNGYTWSKDLRIFRDFSPTESKERGRNALQALQCNAEHFRDYSAQLGQALVDLEINGKHLVELYGFYFPTKGAKPLSVAGGKNEKPWKAADLVKLGMKMDDLFGAEMTFVEQYVALKPTDDDEVGLGTTDQDMELLEYFGKPMAIVPEIRQNSAEVRQKSVEVPENLAPQDLPDDPQTIARKYIEKAQFLQFKLNKSKAHGLKK